MDTPTLPVPKQWTRYSTEEQASALATLAENDGNIAATSRATGIPPQTLRQWRDAVVSVPSPDLVEQQKLTRAARWDEVADAGLDQALEKLPEASARDAAVIAGIATDKALLLRGQPTSITERRDDPRIAELRKLFCALAEQQPAPQQPAPIVLTDAKTAEIPAKSEESGAT